MAKKRKSMPEAPGLFPDMGGMPDMDFENFDNMRQMLLSAMAAMGVTPEEYASFLANRKSPEEQMDRFLSMADELGISDGMYDDIPEAHPMPDADRKSLRLKIQMRGITKPPMWREIIIPADFNFSQLHHAIQAVTNLHNGHLWQFQEKAYESDLVIGVPMENPMGFGIDNWTHDADKTLISDFLSGKGDKLEYVYDFGDDWIFIVSVQEVMDRQGDVAVCTKWKCDFQPIEDIGGPWAYMDLREAFTNPDKLTAKQKKELAEEFGFDKFKDLEACMDEFFIDIEHVNERLVNLPESGRIL